MGFAGVLITLIVNTSLTSLASTSCLSIGSKGFIFQASLPVSVSRLAPTLYPSYLMCLSDSDTITYGTAQFKLDTRVQQTRVYLTDFVEAHASCSHATRAYARYNTLDTTCTSYTTRYARSLSHANRCTRVANAWGEINKVERPSSIIYSVLEIYQSRVLRHSAI